MRLLSFSSLAILSLLWVTAVRADHHVETILDGLNNPCGVAIQPETGDVFVADSAAGKVVRVKDGKASDVIVEFPLGSYGKGPKFAIGPLGLLFLDKNTLVVGGGGAADGEETLSVFTIGDAGAEAKKADATEQTFKLEGKDELKGEGNFYAITRTETHVYVTCNGDDTKGWVARAAIKDGNRLENYERYIATKEATEVDAPVGIATSPDDASSKFIVVGQMGEINQEGDSLLTFYSEDKKMLLNLETGLNDITALAYSTKARGTRKQLYALDFSWLDTKQGGIFRLVDDGKGGVQAKKIAGLDKPTAMAFGADGVLYVTVIGTKEEGAEKEAGKLLKIAADSVDGEAAE